MTQRFIYLNVVRRLLETFFKQHKTVKQEVVFIIIDKSDGQKETREKFIKELMSSLKRSCGVKISVSMESSHENKGLQATDFIAWSLFQKYERGEMDFYTMFQHKILFDLEY